MNVKKIRHICNVRGCKNTAAYTVSRTREMGNSIIICSDCAKEICKAINEYDPRQDKKKHVKEPPALFYPQNIKKRLVSEEDEKVISFVCDQCKKEYKTEKGLEQHMKTHKEE